jgi:hypothetical protein
MSRQNSSAESRRATPNARRPPGTVKYARTRVDTSRMSGKPRGCITVRSGSWRGLCAIGCLAFVFAGLGGLDNMITRDLPVGARWALALFMGGMVATAALGLYYVGRTRLTVCPSGLTVTGLTRRTIHWREVVAVDVVAVPAFRWALHLRLADGQRLPLPFVSSFRKAAVEELGTSVRRYQPPMLRLVPPETAPSVHPLRALSRRSRRR